MKLKELLASHIESSVVLGAILVVSLFVIGTQGAWLESVPSVLRLTAQVGIIVIGQALLMTAGEVDLSVGSVFAFVGVAFLLFLDWGAGIFLSALLALSVAAVIGYVNGYVTVRFNVPSMIVTLGAMFIFRGLVYILTNGFSLSVPRAYRENAVIEWMSGQSMGLNHSVYILALLTALFVYIFARTRLGSHIHAVGGDAESAAANGVSPAATKTKTFMLCSVLSGLAAIVVTCQEGSVYSTSGKLIELETIAAAVIGGCTLRGGLGSVWGAVLGVFVLSSLKGGLMMMGAPTHWYISFVGAILIGFLIVSRLINNSAGAQE